MIPLHRPYIDGDELKEVKEVLDSGWLTQGPKVKELEEKVCERTGAAYAVACSSCTAALHLALMALGVGPGDKVIVADYTFPATGHAVLYCGATPVFVDVHPKTYNMVIDNIPKTLWEEAKAVIPVHTFGQCAGMATISATAKEFNVAVIEDAACAFGSYYGPQHAGSIGDIGCFSLHATKGICAGEGGVLVTSNPEIAVTARRMATHGIVSSWDRENTDKFKIPQFAYAGYNYKMSDITAAVGVAQLRKLSRVVRRKRELASIWNDCLEDMPLISSPFVTPGLVHNYQGYTTLVDKGVDRNAVIQKLKEYGVQTQIGTYASHTQPVYGCDYSCPTSLDVFNRALRLPLFYELDEDVLGYAAGRLEEVLKECLL